MHLYLEVCYLITVLSTTRSYVLLAANIEDFRSLAKQFVPDHMADDILEMARDAIGRDSTKKAKQKPSEENDEESQERNPSEVETRSHSYRIRNKPSEHSKGNFELSLDDLVEKVKERLQSELTDMAVTAAKKKIINKSDIKRGLKRPPRETEEPNYNSEAPFTEEPVQNQPSRYVEEAREEQESVQEEIKPNRKPADNKYVAEVFVAQPPKYLYNLGKPVTLQDNNYSPQAQKIAPNRNIGRHERNKMPNVQLQGNTNQNNNRERINRRPKSEQNNPKSVAFVGVDMKQINDSYEDYVLPKKDNDYFYNEGGTKQKKEEIMDTEFEPTTEANYEEETVNYNKKKRKIAKSKDEKYFKQRNKPEQVSVVPLAAENDQQLQPYVEQLQEVYADETEEVVTEEPKARSAKIDLSGYTSQYLAPKAPRQGGNGNKINKKPRQATVIPKRDMYKLSSPNYLVKIPIVGEKYHFDEPIPEEDREPEDVKGPLDAQGLINGKLLI